MVRSYETRINIPGGFSFAIPVKERVRADHTTQLAKLLRNFSTPSEYDIDKAFIDGAKSICNLIKENKIDADIAKQILKVFSSFYIESKIDSTIRGYVSKKGESNFLLEFFESRQEGE